MPKFGAPLPNKMIAHAYKADSYVPSISPFRRTDRAVAQSIDSYRPSSSRLVHTRPQAQGLDNLEIEKNPATLNRSAASLDPILIRPSKFNNASETIAYKSQEKVMETSATAIGSRREFFQCLQKKRVSFRTSTAK